MYCNLNKRSRHVVSSPGPVRTTYMVHPRKRSRFRFAHFTAGLIAFFDRVLFDVLHNKSLIVQQRVVHYYVCVITLNANTTRRKTGSSRKKDANQLYRRTFLKILKYNSIIHLFFPSVLITSTISF